MPDDRFHLELVNRGTAEKYPEIVRIVLLDNRINMAEDFERGSLTLATELAKKGL